MDCIRADNNGDMPKKIASSVADKPNWRICVAKLGKPPNAKQTRISFSAKNTMWTELVADKGHEETIGIQFIQIQGLCSEERISNQKIRVGKEDRKKHTRIKEKEDGKYMQSLQK